MSCLTRPTWKWLGSLFLAAGWSLLGVSLHAAPSLPAATLLWKFSLDASPFGWLDTPPNGRRNTSTSTPAIAPDGTIYVGSFNGTVLAITPDGKLKWRFKTGLEVHSSPAIGDDGVIYFGSRDRNCYAVNPDGSLKWKLATGAWVDASPAIARDGTVYFGSWDHHFYAVNPDGSLKWKFDARGIVDASPAIGADGTIYFGSHDKNFYALNPDGSVRWKFATGGEIVASPAIGREGEIYFSSLDGNLYALGQDGLQRWKYHTGSSTFSSPVLDDEGDIAIGNTNHTDVISKTGHLLWSQFSPVRIDVTAAAVAGRFYFSVPWRALQAIEARDHALWQAQMEFNASSSLTVGRDGTLYVCSELALYAFRPPDQSLSPANSPWPLFQGNARHTGRAEKQNAETLRAEN